MELITLVSMQFVAFASGAIISGAVFALIATIGIVVRFSQKTCTNKYMKHYERCIIIGGIFGCTTLVIDYYLPFGKIFVALFSMGIGIFVGCLAVSLAEILDVIPILTRRGKIAFALPVYIFSVAVGKLVGSIIYYVIPGFYYL